jgi:transcriptional regulator with XRE-family HTH domain
MKSFAETMQEVMDEKGIKAVDIYRNNDTLTQQYISKLLRGKFEDPTFSKALAIIAALGMTPDEFLARQEG